eukprot:TRINITY_DN34041_c0_g1_i1.p1 TRINITY_DN34041_c0_g1~~TRINITY_DN34041_c0_g1_i1.p1  ORF type:complete len:701 (+),score=145.15 TRINITY_DN34041_c0_g1_i1:68-2170(+)
MDNAPLQGGLKELQEAYKEQFDQLPEWGDVVQDSEDEQLFHARLTLPDGTIVYGERVRGKKEAKRSALEAALLQARNGESRSRAESSFSGASQSTLGAPAPESGLQRFSPLSSDRRGLVGKDGSKGYPDISNAASASPFAALCLSAGRLWQCGRTSENYDKLGPCLGSGGMGSVWAARVSAKGAGKKEPKQSCGTQGHWVALKAIPVEVQLGQQDAGMLQSSLRECLSTFAGLSANHVVRYEHYWLEEPEQLPEEMRSKYDRKQQGEKADASPKRAADDGSDGQPGEALSDISQEEGPAAAPQHGTQSLRFLSASHQPAEPPAGGRWARNNYNGGAGAGYGNDFASGLLTSTSNCTDSCAFVFEDSCAEIVNSISALATPSRNRSMEARHLDSAHSGKLFPAGAADENKARRLEQQPATQQQTVTVVLLIEMELMGPPPEGSLGASQEVRTTLRSWLQRPDRTFSDVADVFGALMMSVRHIHRKRIVHADLKPDNIFCVATPSSGGSKVSAVRIGDFGLAGENKMGRQFTYGQPKQFAALGGTPGYVAPEVLNFRQGTGPTDCSPCTEKVDIYACAVILLELLIQPFRTHMERAHAMDKVFQQRQLPDFVFAKLPKTRALILEMCYPDPASRPSAEEVCKRLDKEVRKELCRSGTQTVGVATFSEQPEAGKGGGDPTASLPGDISVPKIKRPKAKGKKKT